MPMVRGVATIETNDDDDDGDGDDDAWEEEEHKEEVADNHGSTASVASLRQKPRDAPVSPSLLIGHWPQAFDEDADLWDQAVLRASRMYASKASFCSPHLQRDESRLG